MNGLQMWIGIALAHSLWQGVVVAAVLAIAVVVTRRSTAQVRYGLACAAMLTMLASFAVTLMVTRPESPIHVKGLVPPPAIARVGAAITVSEAPAEPILARLAGWATPAWMLGMTVLLLYRFAGWIAAQRLRRLGTQAVPDEWSRRFEALVARLDIPRNVRVFESYLAEVPMAIGYLRPVVLVPIGMLAGLPGALTIDQVQAILLHELAHIRRADYLVNLLQTVVESVLFYHPAVWWISSIVRAERENCCDDFVLARDTDPRTYAAALVALEQGRSAVPALSANGGNLKRRVQRILRGPASPSRIALGPVILAIVAAGVALAWQQPQTKTSSKPAATDATRTSSPSTLKSVDCCTVGNVMMPKPGNNGCCTTGIVIMPTRLPPRSEPQRIAQQVQLRQPIPAPKPSALAQWIGDVRYIITGPETNAWADLTNDDEREEFIKQFWARRDPTPGTEVNEYRDEHYRRIAYTNAHFAFSGHVGSYSDRGRIYITYGPPDELESHPGGSYQRPAVEGGGTTSTYPFQKWRYRYIAGLGSGVIMEFVDDAGNGEYRMAMEPSQKEALAQVPGNRPDMPLRVVQGVASRRSDQIREQLAGLRARYTDSHPEVLKVRAQLDSAIQEEAANGANGGFRGAHSGVWIYGGGKVTLVIPLAGARPLRIYGRVRTSEGKPILSFEEGDASGDGLNFTRTIQLKPGRYAFSAALNGETETTSFEVN